MDVKSNAEVEYSSLLRKCKRRQVKKLAIKGDGCYAYNKACSRYLEGEQTSKARASSSRLEGC